MRLHTSKDRIQHSPHSNRVQERGGSALYSDFMNLHFRDLFEVFVEGKDLEIVSDGEGCNENIRLGQVQSLSLWDFISSSSSFSQS